MSNINDMFMKSHDSSMLLTGNDSVDPTQESDFLEAMLERFQLASKQSILNKRQLAAKNDPREEIYELHLEI